MTNGFIFISLFPDLLQNFGFSFDKIYAVGPLPYLIRKEYVVTSIFL